MKFVTFNAPNL